jgi:AAA+ ATPase superfamily predicted ATPase
VARIKDFLEAVAEGEKGNVSLKEVKEVLKKIRGGEVRSDEIPRKIRQFLIYENVLFYNPLEGVVRPQSRLMWRTIREVMGNK